MIKAWTDSAWEDYLYWQGQDRKTLKRINKIIEDIERNQYTGVGKPERLVGDLSDYWSRRIDSVNRIVYRIKDNVLQIVQCGSHYRIKYLLEKCVKILTKANLLNIIVVVCI